MKIHIFLLLSFFLLAKCSLLEMSQVLWTRLLAGRLTKGSALDPLRVPVIKVDQSEGNTSYRIVLRNVEIRGLNFSTLESVHIARGRLKSNLSELEAGYVSYSDLRELDSIRYRFHTLIKEPKSEKETERKIPSRGTNFTEQSNSSELRFRNGQVGYRNPSQIRSHNFEPRDEIVDVVYAQNFRPFEIFNSNNQRKQNFNDAIQQRGEIAKENTRHQNPYESFDSNRRNEGSSVFRGNQKYREFNERRPTSEQDDANVSASENFELKQAFVETKRPNFVTKSCSNPGDNRKYESINFDNLSRETGTISEPYRRQDDEMGRRTNSKFRQYAEQTTSESKINYQTPPGYVDIVYADDDDKKIRHFAGLRRKDDQEMKVYGLEEIMKDLEKHNRYIVHNFTQSEAIQKRNNRTRIAAESKRIKDLIRYAENFQEKQGYYEQGMQLIYHFGGVDDLTPQETFNESESNEAKRRKREHNKDDIEEDIMHIIVGLRIPLLQVKADYLLTGKVGNEILRGNGLLTGNFTELIGNFTLELKKVGENNLIVRAARARLVANNRKVNLQGMNEKGPVESILVHGLMAAEAVAAMIADDLATKTLSENPPTDTLIYKMYSNDPEHLVHL